MILHTKYAKRCLNDSTGHGYQRRELVAQLLLVSLDTVELRGRLPAAPSSAAKFFPPRVDIA